MSILPFIGLHLRFFIFIHFEEYICENSMEFNSMKQRDPYFQFMDKSKIFDTLTKPLWFFWEAGVQMSNYSQ